MTVDYDVAVIGAGHNGLVASWYLASAGLKVGVFERAEQVGGACVTEEMFHGYRVSSCAQALHMLQPKIIDDLALGEHGLEVINRDPVNTSFFPNGRFIRSWDDDDMLIDEIARISRHDSAAYPEYRRFQLMAARILERHFLSQPPTMAELMASCRGTAEEDVLTRLLTGTLSELLNEHFVSAEVRATQASPGDIGDPESPGSLLGAAYFWLGLLTPRQYVGLARGGMGAVTQAMAAAATKAGVSINTGVPVETVSVKDGIAIGLVLEDGADVQSRVVMSNADPKRTLLRLTPDGVLDDRTRSRIASIGTRAASLKFTATLSELPDFSRWLGHDHDPTEIAGIRICPSTEWSRRAWFDARRGRWPRTPVLHAQIPTVCDPSVAPVGRHVFSSWVQFAPVVPATGTWDTLRAPMAERIIAVLADYAPNMRSAISEWHLSTPAEMEALVGLTDGQIRHVDMTPAHLFGNRPIPGWSYRTPVRNLYLCGAGTHPGGEVTGAPGHNAAQAVLRDLGA